MEYNYWYSRWDGTQRIFDLDPEALMDEVSREMLVHGDLWRALRELMRRGLASPHHGQQLMGLRDLLDRLRHQRTRFLERYNLDSVVNDLKERLDRIVETERHGIDRRLRDARQQVEQAQGEERTEKEALYRLLEERARRNREKLDSLPPGVGGAIHALMDYDFIDPDAAGQFQELLNLLRQRMVENFFNNVRGQIRSLTPQDLSALREMLRGLNRMLRDRLTGQEPDFQGFMERFGHMFGPETPRNLDELLQQMARQIAQAQSMLASMSPEMRRELMEALESALDAETRQELAELSAYLSQFLPLDQLGREYTFLGGESLTLDQASEVMRRLQDIDELEKAIQHAIRTGELDRIDPDLLERYLGRDARRNWDELNRIRKVLEDAGYLKGGDRLELTPRGIRRIGQKALKEVFQILKRDRAGDHRLEERGVGGEAITETKPYEFGDPFQPDLSATVRNAVFRQGPGVPVRIAVEDMEVYRTESTTRAATVLLIDQSRSMGLFGSFQAARKVALALYALIHTRYPRDILHVIGFSDYAVPIKEKDLPSITWNAWVSGTNMHHALMLARHILAREQAATRQIILITDGEPTAHLEEGRCFFAYPPSYRTILETLKEVERCTREGIVINTFMLENSYQLLDFIDRLTRINRGRAFYTTPDRLGEYVLVDYVRNRRKRIS